jgi:hypothetical protein
VDTENDEEYAEDNRSAVLVSDVRRGDWPFDVVCHFQEEKNPKQRWYHGTSLEHFAQAFPRSKWAKRFSRLKDPHNPQDEYDLGKGVIKGLSPGEYFVGPDEED